jgi:small-conductance mechanosensitive channel
MPRNYQSFTPMISLRALPRFSAIPIGLTLLALCGIAGAATGTAAPGAGAANPPAQAPGPPLSAEQVIQVLDQTVDWYRALDIQQQGVIEPSEVLILYEMRQTANQVVGLAFDIARANSDLLGKDPAAAQQGEDATGSSQRLTQLQKKLDAQALSIQSELASARQQMTGAPKKLARELQAKTAELQAELDLVNAKRDILSSLMGFENGGAANSHGSSLRAQIDAMAAALPAANAAPTAPAAAARATSGPVPSAGTTAVARFGIWDLAVKAFKLSDRVDMVVAIDRRTEALQSTLAEVRQRLIDQMRILSTQGDALAAQADTANSAALGQIHNQLDALASEFKQISAVFIPLTKENVLLGQYRRNLTHWHTAVENEFRDALKTVVIRIGVLLIVLAAVFALAELSRRAVLRYVQDARRRYQLLLLRKIALWSLVAVIVGLACANELGSVATFAGLMTAGLALALQSVLVSVVGYFLLIGKYGIRVGDRVQIGDVHGEVIDVGIVRMYLMEFAALGSTRPTGRVVAFPNSVVFQVSTGLFKQIPGVNLTWHDMTLGVPAGVDYATIKEKLNAAAIDALKDYRDEIQRQTEAIQRTTLSSSGGDALPTVRLNFSAKGVEAHVRYPVHLRQAAETDERVSQALLQVISSLTPTEPGASPAARPPSTEAGPYPDPGDRG